jgi:hypothetical protein
VETPTCRSGTDSVSMLFPGGNVDLKHHARPTRRSWPWLALNVAILAGFALSAPLTAGTITYVLTDVHETDGPAITGSFSIDSTTDTLLSYDIVVPGFPAFLPSNAWYDDLGASSLGLLQCSPRDCSLSPWGYDLSMGVQIPFLAAAPYDPISNGWFEADSPNDQSEWNTSFSGGITLSPEPSSFVAVLLGAMGLMGERRRRRRLAPGMGAG